MLNRLHRVDAYPYNRFEFVVDKNVANWLNKDEVDYWQSVVLHLLQKQFFHSQMLWHNTRKIKIKFSLEQINSGLGPKDAEYDFKILFLSKKKNTRNAAAVQSSSVVARERLAVVAYIARTVALDDFLTMIDMLGIDDSLKELHQRYIRDWEYLYSCD